MIYILFGSFSILQNNKNRRSNEQKKVEIRICDVYKHYNIAIWTFAHGSIFLHAQILTTQFWYVLFVGEEIERKWEEIFLCMCISADHLVIFPSKIDCVWFAEISSKYRKSLYGFWNEKNIWFQWLTIVYHCDLLAWNQNQIEWLCVIWNFLWWQIFVFFFLLMRKKQSMGKAVLRTTALMQWYEQFN